MTQPGPQILFTRLHVPPSPLGGLVTLEDLFDYVGQLVGLCMTQYGVSDGISSLQDLLVREHEAFEHRHLELTTLHQLQRNSPHRLHAHRRWVEELTNRLVGLLTRVGVVWPTRLEYLQHQTDALWYTSQIDARVGSPPEAELRLVQVDALEGDAMSEYLLVVFDSRDFGREYPFEYRETVAYNAMALFLDIVLTCLREGTDNLEALVEVALNLSNREWSVYSLDATWDDDPAIAWESGPEALERYQGLLREMLEFLMQRYLTAYLNQLQVLERSVLHPDQHLTHLYRMNLGRDSLTAALGIGHAPPTGS